MIFITLQRSWKHILIPYILGERCDIYLFLFLSYIFAKICTRKNFGPTNVETLAPRNIHGRKFWTHEGPIVQWHETRETHDVNRQTEFSALFLSYMFCISLLAASRLIDQRNLQCVQWHLLTPSFHSCCLTDVPYNV